MAAGGAGLLGGGNGGVDVAPEGFVHYSAFHVLMGGEGTDVQGVNAGLSRSVHLEREEAERAGDAAEDTDQDEETGAQSELHGSAKKDDRGNTELTAGYSPRWHRRRQFNRSVQFGAG